MKDRIDIDSMLEELKNRPAPEAEFPPVAGLKAEFLRRTAREEVLPRPLWTRVFKYAAMFMVPALALGVVILAYRGEIRTTIIGTATTLGGSVGEAEFSRKTFSLADRPDVDVEMPPPAKSKTENDVRVYADALAPESSARPMAPLPARMEKEAIRSVIVAGEAGSLSKCVLRENKDISQTEFNTEEYKNFTENTFLRAADRPLSTFGADVDTASYTNVRRMLLSENRLPVRDAVRTEELLNYFRYDYPAPAAGEDFAVKFELGDCPWAPKHKLLLLGVQGRKVEKENLPPSNFVFLIDNSGSMYEEMPLVISALKALAGQLREQDRISVVTYGGGVRVLLDSVSGTGRKEVAEAIGRLTSGGHTPGAAGIQEAYRLAHKNFITGGNNRIVLITDGDFNVGTSSESELVELVEKERGKAVYLTAVGVGSGNYKDNKLKVLANKGDGNYIYLDNPREAQHALVNEMSGRMFTLARDVKFQIEFNPAAVNSYRLIGYEARKLADRDFNDDAKDSGEVGVGHQVTALYELVMNDADAETMKVAGSTDKLKYQTRENVSKDELLTFKLRYQQPEGKKPSVLREFVLRNGGAEAGSNFQWAGAVAEFALLLRDSQFKGEASFDSLRRRGQSVLGEDADGNRAEFIKMVTVARDLSKK